MQDPGIQTYISIYIYTHIFVIYIYACMYACIIIYWTAFVCMCVHMLIYIGDDIYRIVL